MTAFELAARLDEDQQLVEAAWAYELALRESPQTLEVLLNLIAVYFALNEGPTVASHSRGQAISGVAFERALELIRQANLQYGPNAEIEAWEMYFHERILGEEPNPAHLDRLAARGSILAQLISQHSHAISFGYSIKRNQVAKAAPTERERIYQSYRS